MYYLGFVLTVAPWRVVLVVVAHEEPHAVVIGFHQLAQRTAEAHRDLDSLRNGFSHLVPWNVGGT